VENGDVVTRRLHQIVMQTPDGDIRTITGDRLPDSILTTSGHARRGVNLARTLLLPKPSSDRPLKQVPRLPVKDGWWLSREARSRLARMRHAIECSTRLDHIENGPSLHRQVRRIEVQTRGRLYTFTGKSLPEFIGICTGQGFKGNHIAQFLFSCDSIPDVVQEQSYSAAVPLAWPGLRDVIHMVLGVAGFLMVRFFLNVIIGIA
jgi:hypothetical protein